MSIFTPSPGAARENNLPQISADKRGSEKAIRPAGLTSDLIRVHLGRSAPNKKHRIVK